VIANHSPEPVVETGLLVKAPEKNRCNSSEAAHGATFSGPVGEGKYRENPAFFAHFRISRLEFLCS
jgi:hypothetical protein